MLAAASTSPDLATRHSRPPPEQVSEVLEQWLALQRQWMYLEPIFSSPDIMQQLPLEGKRFAAVDRTWRKTLEAARKAPNVLKVGCSTGRAAACATVQQCNSAAKTATAAKCHAW